MEKLNSEVIKTQKSRNKNLYENEDDDKTKISDIIIEETESSNSSLNKNLKELQLRRMGIYDKKEKKEKEQINQDGNNYDLFENLLDLRKIINNNKKEQEKNLDYIHNKITIQQLEKKVSQIKKNKIIKETMTIKEQKKKFNIVGRFISNIEKEKSNKLSYTPRKIINFDNIYDFIY